MQVDQPLHFVGEMGAIFRLALAERLFLAVIGGGEVVDAGEQGSEHLAVIDNAADRGTAETDAMIAALAADQPGAGALTVDLVIGQRDLQRGIRGLRSGIAEEDMIEPGGREIGDAACKFEGLRNAELERRRVVQRLGLLGDRRGNLGAAVTGVGAPHARRGVDDLAAVDGEVVHVLGAGEEPRRLLEGAVGGERHPVCGEVVRDVDGGGAGALVQHGRPSCGFRRDGTRAGYQLHLATETGNCEPVSNRSGFGQGRLRDRTRRSRTPRRRTPRYRAREIGFAETPPPAPAGSVRFRTTARLLMSDAVSHLSRCGG